MRRLTVLSLFLAVIFSACNAKTNETTANQESAVVEQKVKTITLTKAEFLKKVANYEANPNEWKYLGDKPAIIDFYADWCGPCRQVAPILEELAGEYEGEIYVYKIDVEAEKELAGVFGIQSLPSLLFVSMDGKPQMVMGAQPKENLIKGIDEVLLKK